MSESTLGRLLCDAKTLSAGLGIGVLVTMGALTLSNQTSSVSSESWRADTSVTFIPVTRTRSSATPQYITDPCDWATWHVQVHHDYC